MSDQQQILVVLTTPEYINNYLWTNALNGLERKYGVTLLIPDNLQRFLPKNLNFNVHSLPQSSFTEHGRLFGIYSDVLRWRYKKKSKSFLYRDMRINSLWNILQGLIDEWKKSCFEFEELKQQKHEVLVLQLEKFRYKRFPLGKQNYINSLFLIGGKFLYRFGRLALRQMKVWFRSLILHLLSKWPLLLLLRFFFDKIRAPTLVQNYLSVRKFDVVVLPSSAFEPMAIHLAEASQRAELVFFMIVDNWDNLSSKTILWKLPHFMATWGRQSNEHATRIQGMNSEHVFSIGTARFSEHLTRRNEKMSSPFDFNYALFTGTFLPFDEYKCLKILNQEIANNPEIYHDFRIVYRPHPYARRSPCSSISELDHIIIDLAIPETTDESTEIIDYHRSLLVQKSAKFLVGGLTSMLIEGSILGKQFLAVVHKERFNLTSPHRVLGSYEHFSGIEKLPNLHFSHSFQELPIRFREVYLSETPTQHEIDSELSYFYDLSPDSFPVKLDRILDQIAPSILYQ